MVKIFNRIISAIVLIIVILSLFACSVNGGRGIFSVYKLYDSNTYETAVESGAGYRSNGAFLANASMKMAASNDFAVEEAADDLQVSQERKIIKRYTINAETNNFDESYESLKSMINSYNGLIDNSSLYNNNYGNGKTSRTIDMQVRIPTERALNFVDYLVKNLNVTYKSESSEDVTDNYNDTNIRISTLEKEITRLQELLKKAEKVSELVEIEDKISSVTYEIQRLKNRIANLDSKIDYTTININLSEVKVLTEVQEELPSSDKIKQAFNKNLSDTKQFIINIGIYLFTHIPAILLLLIVIFIICISFIVKDKIKKSSKKSKQSKTEDVTTSEDENLDLKESHTDESSNDESKNSVDINIVDNVPEKQKYDKSDFDEAFEKLKNNISGDIFNQE